MFCLLEPPVSCNKKPRQTWRGFVCVRLNANSAARQPGINVLLGLFLRGAVALLKAASQFLALALDDVEIIVGQLAPLLLKLALELFPIAFDLDPNSCRISWVVR